MKVRKYCLPGIILILTGLIYMQIVLPIYATTPETTGAEYNLKPFKLEKFITSLKPFFPDNFKGFIKTGITRDRNKGRVLKLFYNVSNPGDYAGCRYMLDGEDLSGYKTLSFFVKGKSGKEDLLISLRTADGIESMLRAGSFLENGINRKWQKAAIPLCAFNGISTFSNIEKISFVFKNGLGSAKGFIYIDMIGFQRNLAPLPLMNCSQKTGKTAWDRDSWKFEPVQSDTSVNFNKHGCHIKFENASPAQGNVSKFDWGFNIPGINVSDYELLSLKIKQIDSYKKTGIYLCMDDGTAKACVNAENYAQKSGKHQVINIPVKEFSRQGVDTSNIKKIFLSFEGKKLRGSVYIDDIQFEQIHIG